MYHHTFCSHIHDCYLKMNDDHIHHDVCLHLRSDQNIELYSSDVTSIDLVTCPEFTKWIHWSAIALLFIWISRCSQSVSRDDNRRPHAYLLPCLVVVSPGEHRWCDVVNFDTFMHRYGFCHHVNQTQRELTFNVYNHNWPLSDTEDHSLNSSHGLINHTQLVRIANGLITCSHDRTSIQWK